MRFAFQEVGEALCTHERTRTGSQKWRPRNKNKQGATPRENVVVAASALASRLLKAKAALIQFGIATVPASNVCSHLKVPAQAIDSMKGYGFCLHTDEFPRERSDILSFAA